ncbi:MAG: heavy-metal-associated domain-containing protein [Proteobacteria bacterium]|nr:heavy-metal-associated domain-containing protein [Pseudomonadota bacterium]
MQILLLLIITSVLEAGEKTCYKVEGMVCGSCAKKIEDHFSKLKTIQNVTVSLLDERVDLKSTDRLKTTFVQDEFKKLKLKAEQMPCD